MPSCRTCLGGRLCPKIQFSAIFTQKHVQQGKPFKKESNDYIIKKLWFRATCTILHDLQNTNLQTLPENSVLCSFHIYKSMLESTQHITKIDLDFM